MGYALLGKTVAYIGVPPLYIGEVVFALGIIAFLSSRCVIASFAALPNLLLALLIGWGIIRTLPYLRENGFDALRDSMLVLYGGFAFIVTALLLEKPERLQLLIKFLRFLALVLVPLAPIIVIMTNAAAHAEGEVTHGAGPCQDRDHRGSSFRSRAVGHSRPQAPEPPVVLSSDCRHGRGRQPATEVQCSSSFSC